MVLFDKIEFDGDICITIQDIFSIELDIAGGWGYDKELATIIKSYDTSIKQLEHTLASMRSHIEMSILRTKKDRYGSINLNEIKREELEINGEIYHEVTYLVSAMKEEEYNAFIDEYKEYYGSVGFDIEKHFNNRNKSTLHRDIKYWFKIFND
jgi:hypothetical protein